MRFEATVDECIVSQGEIPKDLAGGYYRVGPTWKRPTKQGTNPLLSMDGMVQAITFEGGRAAFRNRWVQTPKMQLEDKHHKGMFAWSDGGFHDWRDFAYGDVERDDYNRHTPQGVNNINVFPFAGHMVVSGEHADVKPGNAMPAGNIPIGTIVHNVEIKIGKGGQIARSAGTYAQIVGRDGEYVILRLNSAEQRLVHGRCMATIGAVSNPDNMNVSIGKAGRKRWMGRMPHNRGVAMNPIDHPHGGGEGRTSGGRHPVTPWGFPTKGKKTRKNKSTTKFIISSRHARKKK